MVACIASSCLLATLSWVDEKEIKIHVLEIQSRKTSSRLTLETRNDWKYLHFRYEAGKIESKNKVYRRLLEIR